MKGTEKQIKYAMDIIAEAEKRINAKINENSTEQQKKVAEYKVRALHLIVEDMDAGEIIGKKATLIYIANDYEFEHAISMAYQAAVIRKKDIDERIMNHPLFIERINAIKEMKVSPY